ncbi:hypothetical protein FQ192_16085 [Pseudomonas sp. ANT_J12]|uniref:hypothetical protein n=1 Tax=Pseudomonas sp. ANT_J12 TaxID=2597351 RepID=UPI0011F0A8AC|nr:hypothetical protein [Pseudomonas sp. ANT_J12]KAA0988567.1 hypothetical protein FQ192_16085 [Pseudomonas sp. ANT_J12]
MKAGYFKGFEVKRWLLLVVGVLPLAGRCEVVSENLCFELDEGSPVKFELRTYYDTTNKLEGGFVKYASSGVPIPLVLTDHQEEEVSPGRPWLATTMWTEVSEGKVTGEYEMVSQGVTVLSMTYTKKSNGKQYKFSHIWNIDSSLETGCQWEQ